LAVVTPVSAQGRRDAAGILDAGTTIPVRTNETIKVKDDDGRIFTAAVDQDVRKNGVVVIPRGSDVELVARRISGDEIGLDLDAITVSGRRYVVDSQTTTVEAERKDGIGANKRTGKYVGGGAILGAIIGGIAGGGKGAAIGAGIGAAGGAGTQVLTRGKSIEVPAESLLTFRLDQPLRATSSVRSTGAASVYIGPDNFVTWTAPETARVFVKVDNNPMQLFAEGKSGRELAPWIEENHLYLFIVRDANGTEIARDRLDLRAAPTLPRRRS
jgi:hypothetical protein